MFRKVLVLIFIVTLPLIPSVVIFYLFKGQSLAEYGDFSKGIKLGGPIAAYFIIFIFTFSFYKRITPPEIEQIIKKQKINSSMQERILGKWNIEVIYSDKDEGIVKAKVKGNANVYRDNSGILKVSGVYDDETKNVKENTWNADEIILTETKLIYLFHIQPGLDNPNEITGLTTLYFTYDTKKQLIINKMSGSGGFIGGSVLGQVTWSRD